MNRSQKKISITIDATLDFDGYNYATDDEVKEVCDTMELPLETDLSGRDVSIMGMTCKLNGVQVKGIEPYE